MDQEKIRKPKRKSLAKSMRQDLVRSMIARGMKQADMLNTLKESDKKYKNLTLRTIERDVSEVRAEFEGQFDSSREIRMFELRNNEVFGEAWNIFHGSSKPGLKLAALRLAEETAEKRISVLQSLGALPKHDNMQINQVMNIQQNTVAARILQMGPIYEQLEQQLKEAYFKDGSVQSA